MAGVFGYDASTYDLSMLMAEENLLPKVRESKGSDIIIADGTSVDVKLNTEPPESITRRTTIDQSLLVN